MRLLVVTASGSWTHWQRRCVEQLCAVEGVQWASWSIVPAARQQRASPGWTLLSRLDRSRFASAGDPDAPVPPPEGAPVPMTASASLPVRGVAPDDGVRPAADVLAAWRTQALDVIVWLCPQAPCAGLAEVARSGVWVLTVDGLGAAHLHAGADAVLRAPHLCEAALWDYGTAPPRSLYRSVSAASSNSLAATRRRVLAKAQSFMARCLASLAADSALPRPPLIAAALAASPSPPQATAWSLALAMGRQVALNRWHRLWGLDQWQLAYTFDAALPWHDLRGWRFLVPPPDRFWADPMPLSHAGANWIFFEELPFRARRGRLLAQALHADGSAAGAPVQVMAMDSHLSYPFVFVADDEIYLVPETASLRQVRLYRCQRLPDRWELAAVLLDGVNAVDATLHRRPDGRWWMWVSVVEEGAERGEELHVYSADTLLGPWRGHRHNPLVSDIRCARPAGPIRSTADGLLRPAQNSGEAYGHHIVWRRVQTLDDDEYIELPAGELRPTGNPDWLRMHTVTQAGALRVVDVMVRRRRGT